MKKGNSYTATTFGKKRTFFKDANGNWRCEIDNGEICCCSNLGRLYRHVRSRDRHDIRQGYNPEIIVAMDLGSIFEVVL